MSENSDTNAVEDQADNVSNLPEIEDTHDKEKGTNKKLIGISIIIGVVVSAVALAWAGYTYAYLPHMQQTSYEAEQAQETIESLIDTSSDVPSINSQKPTPEPEPDPVEQDDYDYSNEGTTSGDVNKLSSLENVITNINETLLKVLQGITTNSTDIQTSHSDLKQNLKVIADNQQVLADASKTLSKELEKARTESSQVIERLDSILYRLDTLNKAAELKEQILPVTVYTSGSWGGKMYLTVSPNDYPTQTFKLFSGQSVGMWKLVTVADSRAVFKHSQGFEKVVKL